MYLIQNLMIFQSPFLDLTQPCCESTIAACSRNAQLNSGDIAAGSRASVRRNCTAYLTINWDHEVEVLPCERDANPGENTPGENRLISGCLWSLSQTPFSLPKQAQGATELKKTLLLGSKTSRQRLGQGRRSGPDMSFLFGMSLWKGCFI